MAGSYCFMHALGSCSDSVFLGIQIWQLLCLNQSMAKMFTLIGGCNGAGKSTYASRHFSDADFINPDAMQAEMGVNAFEIGRVVVDLVAERLAADLDFILETTFSDRRSLKLLEHAKALGWATRVVFSGLGSIELHKARVAMRVQKGGHAISDELIERRYPRSIENLGRAFDVADEVFVLDNSGDDYREIVEVSSGSISNTFPHAEVVGNFASQVRKLTENRG